MSFDSKPELAFYVWLKDNNIRFKYHPDRFFEYNVGRNVSRYYPDFILSCGLVIEIKGIHFFENYNKGGRMILPYKYRNRLSRNQVEALNAKYEAKHRCMIHNNVIVLTNDDYKQYVDYVKATYGPGFINSCRMHKSS